MYCILIAGIPASGKSRTAEFLAERLGLPALSKDDIKERMYDTIGFRSREEKVKLGIASMDILYYAAEQLMKCRQPFILENNFEDSSKEGLFSLLEKYACQAITVTLTGDYPTLYRRFLERNASPDRHRGHVVNDCYPEKEPGPAPPIPYESFVEGIARRGMDRFLANGPRIVLDTTDFSRIDWEALIERIALCRDRILLG